MSALADDKTIPVLDFPRYRANANSRGRFLDDVLAASRRRVIQSDPRRPVDYRARHRGDAGRLRCNTLSTT